MRKSGSGPDDILGSIEQKLLFILVYLKTYPIQIVMAKLFGMSQPRANQWIHRLLPIVADCCLLLPVVKAALDELDEIGVMPERTGEKFAHSERKQGVAKDYAQRLRN
jgi:DNA-binding transcriptional regulator YdaS (Cro superfamily)